MWLDRFERINEQLKVVGIDRTGLTEMLAPDQMYKISFATTNSEKISLTTSFQGWRRATAQEYASAFGITSHVTENHEVYTVDADHTRVLIPAWELQRSLLGAPTSIANYLYASNSLERICAPILDDENFRIEIRIPRTGSRRTTRSTQFLTRLEWFYAYPSAYRAWHSIYQLACKGKIGIELPAVEATISAHGKHIDDTFYVSSLNIWDISPLEPPMDWANNVSRRYDFAGPRERSLRGRQTSDHRIRPVDSRWELDDSEWKAIEEIVSRKVRSDRPGRHRKHSLRQVVDGMIIKMGTGNAWKELGSHDIDASASGSLYHRLRIDGRWDQIADILAKARSHT
ncbi:transposase [Paraburkholderia sp. C35]|uniref:transposase n=1 Tax=Paraburkholderia sp. C35 TaxID=2126993 RepID=UPI000D6928AB|nr:transposase [Paraburkholderia sp. C35]